MSKKRINPDEVSEYVVWTYSIDNVNDHGRKTVLSRRYISVFENEFDPFRIRNVTLESGYGMEMNKNG